MREDGFRLDKIIITSDPGYMPSGLGPAESPRGAPPQEKYLLNSWRDADGQTLNCSYEFDRLTSVVDAYGRSLTYLYSTLRHLVAVSDATGSLALLQPHRRQPEDLHGCRKLYVGLPL